MQSSEIPRIKTPRRHTRDRVRRTGLVSVVCAIVFAALVAACSSGRATRQDAYELPDAAPGDAQREHVLRTVASFKHLGFQVVAARLSLGVDTARAWRQLDTLLSAPTGDIFWMYPAVGFYFTMKSRLDAGWIARFRNAWATYTPYRGDTENHFLMYYASVLLMSQEWPELDGAGWFNGKSSRENYDEAHEYLTHWIDEVARRGSTEWDSPRYAYYYVTPLLLLRDFVADEHLRARCEMMLELTLVDYAAEYLNGSYAGAHSRDGDGSVIDPRRAEVTSYGQLYFADSVAFVLPDLAYAALSPWKCPPIIRAIAHERSSAFVHTERKRSRARMRYSDTRYTVVDKYAYMSPSFCLGSIGGGLQQPIQQHSWDVTYAAARPNNTLFTLHPTWSARELGTFFPEDPELMVEGVARAKASYTNENKWIGGSPYEMIAQDSNTLIAFYDIPPSDPVQHFDLFLPLSADTVFRDTSGWYFIRFGDAFTAVRLLGLRFIDTVETAWRRVRVRAAPMQGPYNGVIVTCAEASDVPFDQFVENIRRNRAIEGIDNLDDRPGIAPTPIAIRDGRGIERMFYWQFTSDGRAFNVKAAADSLDASYREVPALFRGPFVQSAYDTGLVELRFGPHRRVLDFNTPVTR